VRRKEIKLWRRRENKILKERNIIVEVEMDPVMRIILMTF